MQGLLLREAGYRCDEGFLAFDETRERVLVRFDEALVVRILSLLVERCEVAAREVPKVLPGRALPARRDQRSGRSSTSTTARASAALP